MAEREYSVMVEVIVTVPEDNVDEALRMLPIPGMWEPQFLGEDYACTVGHVEVGDWVPVYDADGRP